MTPSLPVRRVLICVSGMSPAVVTETLYALVMQAPAFIPDEIHVITTSTGKEAICTRLLAPETGHFNAFMRDYLPQRHITFNEETVHVISQRSVKTVSPMAGMWTSLMSSKLEDAIEELDDIATDDQNKAAGDVIYRVMQKIKSVPGTILHASVAGGRKSMGFYMGHAFSLLAEQDDKLSHVLVNKPFEDPRYAFYYPPRHPVMLPPGGVYPALERKSTDTAQVQLAELSVLKLGGILGQDWPERARLSFEFAVTLAQAALSPPVIEIDLDKNKAWKITLCGAEIPLSPQQFAIFVIYALARQHEAELPYGAALLLEEFTPDFWSKLSADMSNAPLGEGKNLTAIRSKIFRDFRDQVGPVALHFAIEATGKKSKGQYRPHELKTPAKNLKITRLDHWWRWLRQEVVAINA